MSQVKLIDLVESLQGKMFRKGETIFRCKHYRDANGKISAQGAQEAYILLLTRVTARRTLYNELKNAQKKREEYTKQLK